MEMTSHEAFVETLRVQGVKFAFGIVGSAFMPGLDVFERAGIRFVDVAHEQGAAHMADGYTRAGGGVAICIAQNGPGITNFVTAVAAAYWNHTPMVVITPETGAKTQGMGGFQETRQLPYFEEITCHQETLAHASRMVESLTRCFQRARQHSAPVQFNIPRDMFSQIIDVEIPEPILPGRQMGDQEAVGKAAELLKSAKFPVIVAGAGVVLSDATEECRQLAECLGAPVANSYLHNDSFPASHPLAVGPLGYQGWESAMKLAKQADVILALGTRLNPFSTLPQHDIEYWTGQAKIIQVDSNPDMLGLAKPIDIGICGDARAVAQQLLGALGDPTRRTIPAAPGMRGHGKRSRRRWRRARSCGPFRTVSRRMPWCPRTSATSAPWPTAICPSRSRAAFSPRACSEIVAMPFPPSWGRSSRGRIGRALPWWETAPSVSA
jgi:sulfoacetaldehyde acetyltransferase